MKFLVVTGSPGYKLPGLNVEVKAMSDNFSVDADAVLSELVAQPEGSDERHDVTVLRYEHDAVGVTIAETDDVKTLTVGDYDVLISTLNYLIEHSGEDYDAALILLKMPHSLPALYTSHDEFVEDRLDWLPMRASNRERVFYQDPWVRLPLRSEDTSQYVKDVHALGKKSETQVLYLEALAMPVNGQQPEVVSRRIEDLKQSGVAIAIMDILEANPAKQGAYTISSRTGHFTTKSRMTTFIVEAALDAAKLKYELREQEEDIDSDDESDEN